MCIEEEVYLPRNRLVKVEAIPTNLTKIANVISIRSILTPDQINYIQACNIVCHKLWRTVCNQIYNGYNKHPIKDSVSIIYHHSNTQKFSKVLDTLRFIHSIYKYNLSYI